MNNHYTIYGLHLQSNAAIPGPVRTPPQVGVAVDIYVTLGSFPNWIQKLLVGERANYYTSPWRNQAGEPQMSVDTVASGAYFYFHYDDGVEFVLNQTTTEIWGSWQSNLTLSDAALYLLGPILGFILRRRGVTCLHASCIVVRERALAIVGVSGAGKSTTAAAFAVKGYPILSDDVLPLAEVEQSFQAIPGYPRLRLWPESVEALYGDPDAQPLLTPNYSKRYLDLTNSNYTFRSNPISLNAIYILNPCCNDSAAPFITPESLQNGLFALAANTYRNELLDQTMRRQEFNFLGRLVTHVPLRRVTPHTDIARLPQLCDTILEDFQALSSKPLCSLWNKQSFTQGSSASKM